MLNDIDPTTKIHPTAIIDHNVVIGKNCKIWHWVHISNGAIIGSNCIFGQNVFVSNKVSIGNNVKIQNNVSIYDDVILEDDVFCGPSMVFTNVINPRSHIVRKDEFRKTLVKKGASIGANATIVCGNTIGRFAFIGAGSVVTKDIDDYALVVGNPARQIGWVSENGIKLEFDKNGLATCNESKEKYILKNNKVYKL